jgi:hypothetical protein
MTRRVVVAIALVLAACDRPALPTAPGAPDVVSGVTGAAAAAPSGPRPAAASTLAFLPPLGTGVADSATFDATAAPVVEICAWNGVACSAPPVARFSTTPSGTTLPLLIDRTIGRYEAAWNLLDSRFVSRKTYRIRVLQGTTELGAVSVDVVRGRWGLTRSDGTLTPLIAASTLPIRFTLKLAPPSNRAPTATITAPTPDATFTVGTAITFAGSATDPEDGTLTGASLVWKSDRDGQIGTGTSFSVSTLSVGTHVITLTATDSQGATGTRTVSIVVTAPSGPGPLTNGATATGRIAVAHQEDRWTFTANAGDHAVISLGETGTTSGFSPWIRVLAPNGTEIGSNFGFVAAQVELNNLGAGTYTVIVGSAGGGFTGSGNYLVTVIRAPGALTVSSGDDGGALTNGVTRSGAIYDGDIDGWTFSANAGDPITIDLAETGTTAGFSPWLRVISPTGTVVASNFGFTAAHVLFNAPAAGSYTVVVGSAGGGFTGSGRYDIVLAGSTASTRLGRAGRGRGSM